MPSRRIQIEGVPPQLVEGLELLREQVDVPIEFPVEAVADAEQASQQPLPAWRDMTDIEFVTIDPEGAKDLDQAVFIAREGQGFLVQYAIAAVGFWVKPGGAMDLESHRRGQTFYAPQGRAGLYPPVLSEGAASLLPEPTPRPAYVWTMHVDAAGVVTEATVERALVRSREQLTYVGVQAELDGGNPREVLALLKEVGLLREKQEQLRGGVSLPIPEQEVHADGDVWTATFRSPLPVEGWNAQISLMTGMAAAQMMVDAKIGILRTLPPVDDRALGFLRRVAKGLHIEWPEGAAYGEFLRTLDPTKPTHMAMLQQCTTLFRGAGYMSFDGFLPDGDIKHNAIASLYAHTTAPLRRLVDRYVLEVCASLCAGEQVPAWVRQAMPEIPKIMQGSDARAKKYERGIVNLVEALMLTGREGQEFTGTVTDPKEGRRPGRIMLADPAVEAVVFGYAPLGEEIPVRLEKADLVEGDVVFQSIAQRPQQRQPRPQSRPQPRQRA